MITDRKELKEILLRDSVANYRSSIHSHVFGDCTWKFIVSLRYKEWYSSMHGFRRLLNIIPITVNKINFSRYSVKCGYTIPPNVCGRGLALPHRGNIVINTTAKIGENCRIHEGVTVGSTSGSKQAASIGDNVFIGSGAKIIGEISIANDVAIAANACVVKSITESGTTWGGVPARKISQNNSHSNLAPNLFENIANVED